jgi:acyl-CoA reductase-like NAD-dependent aldehyde dehydrogenase
MCTCISRVLVHNSVYDAMRDRLVAAFKDTRIGTATTPDVDLGPVIDRDNQARLQKLLDLAEREATVLLRGGAGEDELSAGSFVLPTIFEIDDVNHPLVQRELFGPMFSLERFEDEAEAISKANVTRYGLASSVYTEALSRSMRVSRKLKFGTVWLNCHNRLLAEVETGGYRESGIGRLHGIEAMNDFLETKHVYYEV